MVHDLYGDVFVHKKTCTVATTHIRMKLNARYYINPSHRVGGGGVDYQ